MLQNVRVAAFTVSELTTGGVKSPPPRLGLIDDEEDFNGELGSSVTVNDNVEGIKYVKLYLRGVLKA